MRSATSSTSGGSISCPTTFAGTALIRDPGMNVAYWNLHERTVTQRSRWQLAGERRAAALLSLQRLRPGQSAPAEQAPDAHASQRASRPGEPVREVRAGGRAHRHVDDGACPLRVGCARRRAPLGSAAASPLSRRGARRRLSPVALHPAEGAREFIDWLNEPALEAADAKAGQPLLVRRLPRAQGPATRLSQPGRGSRRVPPLDRGLWGRDGRRQRPDARRRATRQEGSLRSGSPPMAHLHNEPWGVNVAGFLQSELGIGEAAARSDLRARRGSDSAASGPWTVAAKQPPGPRYAMFDTDAAAFPVNLVCVNADVLEPWAAQAGERFFAGRYTIGFWWWEVLAFPPKWLPAFDLVDEVWVATQHVADALTPVSQRACDEGDDAGRRTARQLPIATRAGSARGLLVHVPVRPSQRLRAQEPARDDRGVQAGVRARFRREPRDQVHQPRLSPAHDTSGCCSRPPNIPTYTSSTATSARARRTR